MSSVQLRSTGPDSRAMRDYVATVCADTGAPKCPVIEVWLIGLLAVSRVVHVHPLARLGADHRDGPSNSARDPGRQRLPYFWRPVGCARGFRGVADLGGTVGTDRAAPSGVRVRTTERRGPNLIVTGDA